MATRLIQFPVRNAFAPVRSRDSLARDTAYQATQYQAARIAEQVEQEMARKAQRMSVGLRIEFAGARATRSANVIMMPGARRPTFAPSLLDSILGSASALMNKLFRRSSSF